MPVEFYDASGFASVYAVGILVILLVSLLIWMHLDTSYAPKKHAKGKRVILVITVVLLLSGCGWGIVTSAFKGGENTPNLERADEFVG